MFYLQKKEDNDCIIINNGRVSYGMGFFGPKLYPTLFKLKIGVKTVNNKILKRYDRSVKGFNNIVFPGYQVTSPNVLLPYSDYKIISVDFDIKKFGKELELEDVMKSDTLQLAILGENLYV